MKTIVVMRHAKSDWSNRVLADYDRPLNKRGETDAPLIGSVLKQLSLIPDIIISSPALRAKLTAEKTAKTCAYTGEIIFRDSFYFGNSKSVLEAIEELPDRYETVLVIGHNPILEHFISMMVSNTSLKIKLPTAAFAVIKTEHDTWKRVKEDSGILTLLLVPRMLKHLTNK